MNIAPKDLGYRMPAEWESHEGTWLSWPKDPDTFPPGIIEYVEKTYAKIINELSRYEKVFLLVNDEEWEKKAREKIGIDSEENKNVIFKHIKTVDVWTRDYAPVFVKNKSNIAAVKWNFNAWGNKYEELKKDNEAGEKIAEEACTEIFKPGINLEGGSIDCNGKGAIITTEQCLLNENRNKELNKKQIEKYLQDYLGADKIIWLKKGIKGDDTDGHIDDIARFVNENTIVCSVEENEKDDNYKVLRENLQILEKTDFKVVELPMPEQIKMGKRRLPATYANFYIANKIVLVPEFGQESDKKAINILQKLFPERKVIGVPAIHLTYGFGGIHCITQQQPI